MSQTIQETKELIEQSLVSFHEELARIGTSEKKDLLTAERKCPALLDDAFKLQFLRTDLFNPQLAACRFVLYWKNRVQLFGPEKAFLPMTLDGAMKDDIDMLSKGFIRLLPGEARVFWIESSRFCAKTDDVRSVARCVWYTQSQALAESPEMQKMGAVFVLDVGHQVDGRSRSLCDSISQALMDVFPLRFQKLYVVNAPLLIHTICNVFKLLLKPCLRDRVKIYGQVPTKLEKKLGLAPHTLSAAHLDEWTVPPTTSRLVKTP